MLSDMHDFFPDKYPEIYYYHDNNNCYLYHNKCYFNTMEFSKLLHSSNICTYMYVRINCYVMTTLINRVYGSYTRLKPRL